MFKFLKRNKSKSSQEVSELGEQSSPVEESTIIANPNEENGGRFLTRLRKSLTKTRKNFVQGIAGLVLGKKYIDQDLLDAIQEQLILADIGVAASDKVIQNITDKLNRKEIKDSDVLMQALKKELFDLLAPSERPFVINQEKKPFVILMVGVNGVGKTTTIGKLSLFLQKQGHKVLLAAGDTFRAAAIEQLKVWGLRNDIGVIAQETGADSASVIFDAFKAAQARGVDVLIADTAGRLHTQQNLMEELKKVKRVIAKLDPDAPHEVLLVLDAVTGQNGLNQALQFHEAVNLTGLVLTKLDGTAKGGVIFAIAQVLKLPIPFIGIGEKAEDLKPFSAQEFVDALFDLEVNDEHDGSI